MRLIVNGAEHDVPDAWRDEMFLATLREHLGLVGTKYSCGIGLCGACTVHVDGRPVTACTVPTAELEGRQILTIEGLARRDGSLHPLQQAWIDERVPQCGYCQSGQIMRAAALLAHNPRPTEPDIVAAMSANLCRCGTYDRIKKAIRRASGQVGDTDRRADG